MTCGGSIPRRRFTTAFSLVEVVVALAVAAFALIAIASTLPVGLQSMRDSQNDQAIATIQNQIRGELQEISFSTTPGVSTNLLTLPSSRNYYTVEGVKTDVGSVSLPPYYQAQFGVTNAAVNGTGFTNNGISTPLNAANVTVTLSYPYPILTQKTRFTLFATKQTGN